MSTAISGREIRDARTATYGLRASSSRDCGAGSARKRSRPRVLAVHRLHPTEHPAGRLRPCLGRLLPSDELTDGLSTDDPIRTSTACPRSAPRRHTRTQAAHGLARTPTAHASSSAVDVERPCVAAVESAEQPDNENADSEAAWRETEAYLRGNYDLVLTVICAPRWKNYQRPSTGDSRLIHASFLRTRWHSRQNSHGRRPHDRPRGSMSRMARYALLPLACRLSDCKNRSA